MFEFGFLRIYWYGLIIVLGVIVGLFVVLKLAKKFNISSDEVYNLSFYLIIFSILGARIYAVLLDLPFYLGNPFEIIAVWHGGLAIHGAIIGGLITLLIYSTPLPPGERETKVSFPLPRWERIKERVKQNLAPLSLDLLRKGRGGLSFWQWADIIAPAIALGQAIGRWGNYFNQELFGTPTNMPWGIPIELNNRPLEYLNSQYFHPMFLYESVLDLLNFFVLLVLFYKLVGKLASGQVSKWASGMIFLVYLINYSIIRIIMEFFRTDLTPIVGGVRLPIVVSTAVIIAVICLFFWRIKLKVPKS
ncbi:MAG: prolipoprotein diacylglyceryl transferase [Candidatus Buchananbacteria bacterium RIFCSPHIGHO2_01_FULL_39_8]|uniref:Phosphatidylglycerol--prolipoprotein diacylglyceryl transferase n=1 Tax=Candidatus Buchananbacteria bacterium RIFCSPHIGHO2_01_FULL_39_8 TaxID=1797533 RepID=A0A1G1Y0C3_9BACT|nr:MAG: prolipoprotein diacylglyceryl transferase [Candidatus Buchananbacteria bacterium RIFCSPHIGHO2_01_FULL_39_8]